MKKIITILFLFLSFYTCYLVYNLTEPNSKNCLLLGDEITNYQYIKNENLPIEYNNLFINNDYRIIDLLNVIKYNEEKQYGNKRISIYQLFKKADIIILSVGMNDIYSKLNDDTHDIYTYINNMVSNMEQILNKIDKSNNKQVIVLGYYNITNKNNDIFTYLNYKMKKIAIKHHFTYLELNDILKNKKEYLKEEDNYYLNKQGYEEINKLIVENLKKT